MVERTYGYTEEGHFCGVPDLVDDYLNGRLEDGKMAAIDEHADSCNLCKRAVMSALEALSEDYSTMKSLEDLEYISRDE